MQVHIGMDEVCLIGALIGWLEHSVCESHRPNVLHCANPKLGHVDHVVLGKGKTASEQLLVERDTFLNRAEDLRRVNEVKLALRSKYAHRGRSVRNNFVLDDFIVSRAKTVDV